MTHKHKRLEMEWMWLWLPYKSLFSSDIYWMFCHNCTSTWGQCLHFPGKVLSFSHEHHNDTLTRCSAFPACQLLALLSSLVPVRNQTLKCFLSSCSCYKGQCESVVQHVVQMDQLWNENELNIFKDFFQTYTLIAIDFVFTTMSNVHSVSQLQQQFSSWCPCY